MSTKEKLLQAATKLFAENGYRETTVAKICAEAEVNQALINYHFHGKAELYGAVMDQLNEQIGFTKDAFPEVSDPEEWLRLFFESRLQAVCGEDSTEGKFMRMIHLEMRNPSDAQDMVRERYLFPEHRLLRAKLSLLTGVDVDSGEIHVLMMNCLSAITFLNATKHRNRQPNIPGIKTLLLKQTLAFIMAGIRQFKESN